MINIPSPIWVTDDQALTAACLLWEKADFLALDTEFIRTSTFYPEPGLLQLATPEDCWLIDPLTISDWSYFKALMDNPAIVKVFHSCAEDLEVCRCLWGSWPAPLFDTQLAMAFAGLGNSVGFQRAINTLLDIEITKEATRSNWLQRPLSQDQIQYAVADVFYLRQIYPLLKEKVIGLGRLDWLEEDCQRMISQEKQTESFELSYRKVKLGWKLNRREQYVLQQLAVWREEEARRKNVPRNRVADDRALWNLSRYKARNRDQLNKAGIAPAIVRESGKQILQIIARALEAEDDVIPQELERPLSIEAGNQLKTLKKQVVSRAEELAIPAELLANKRMLEPLVRKGEVRKAVTKEEMENETSPLMSGWRYEQIGADLLAQLESL